MFYYIIISRNTVIELVSWYFKVFNVPQIFLIMKLKVFCVCYVQSFSGNVIQNDGKLIRSFKSRRFQAVAFTICLLLIKTYEVRIDDKPVFCFLPDSKKVCFCFPPTEKDQEEAETETECKLTEVVAPASPSSAVPDPETESESPATPALLAWTGILKNPALLQKRKAVNNTQTKN